MKCRFCGGETSPHSGKSSDGIVIEYLFCPTCMVAQKPHTQSYEAFTMETLRKVGHLDLASIARTYSHIAAKMVQFKVGRLLDYGCATGGVLKMMEVFGYDCVGFDICPVSIEVCKKHGLNATRDINEIKGTFDVIWCSETIEHLEDPIELLNFIKARINPKGIVYIQTQQPALENQGYKLPYQAAHTNLLTPQFLEKQMSERGFKVLDGGQNDLGCYWRFFES